ncbi:MAG: hypothetical protein ABJQ29_01780 [Luteolibacter sp.]
MKKLLLLSLIISALIINSQAHTWTSSPLLDENGDLFSAGGGVDVVLDLTFSIPLDKYLMTLRTKDSSLVVVASSDGQRWSTMASETWTWGYNTGTSVANGEALILLIGNGIFRWPYASWTRSRIKPFTGNLESIAVMGSKTAVAGWSTGRVYYSNDWGSTYHEGFASAGMEFLAVSDGSFWGTRSYNTSNDTLLESSDGSFFSVVDTLPGGGASVYGLIGMGSRLAVISSGFGADNKSRFAIYSKFRGQNFVFHGFFNQTPNFSPWAMKSSSTERGGIIALPQRGIIEMISTDTGIQITAREDAQFNLDWRGAAIGTGDCVLVTVNGVVATSQLDLGTDNADLDDDGISDQFETGTGVYMSHSDTGTNPTNRDTDGDGYEDGYEVSSGSNPNLLTSTPLANQAWIQLAVEFSFAARLGESYRIDKSIDMTNWTTLETGVRGNGSVLKRLYPAEGQQKQFFRAVAE